MGKGSKDDASDIIFKYMNDSGRPYSVNDVHNNLQKAHGFGKTVVQRMMDQLVEEGLLKEKAYGKQKIHYVDQSKLDTVDANEMSAIDAELSALQSEMQQLSDEVRSLESQANGLSKFKSADELKAIAITIDQECEKLDKKLQLLKESSRGVDPVENREVKTKFTKHVNEWRKRKRLSTECLNSLLEGYPKPKKTLIEEIGLDTDEDFNVTIPKC